MNPALGAAYEGAARLLELASAIAPAGDSKVARSLRARRDLAGRYARWRAMRGANRTLLWIHAPSVGEGLQARPVLDRLRAAHPDLQLAYTFFSPSAERFASTLDVDFRDYLPFDSARSARRALAALEPSALVFSKLDVWPTLTREAASRRVGLGLISATLAARSSRRSRLARALLRDAYAALDAVGAIDAGDADRLVTLGVRPQVITVTGDTRYDQVWARAQAADRDGALLASLRSDRPTLVAGSTWPSDEHHLLAAWLVLRRGVANARLVIAPHEPDERHLLPIEQWAAHAGLSLSRLDGAGGGEADVVLVDRVGVLGDLYALADVAYVGGAFHGAGLHSVLEPAAFGAPVLFGPQHANSRDAGLLVDRGGGVRVNSTNELAGILTELFRVTGARVDRGERARAVVEGGLGAAARTTALVERLLREHGVRLTPGR